MDTVVTALDSHQKPFKGTTKFTFSG